MNSKSKINRFKLIIYISSILIILYSIFCNNRTFYLEKIKNYKFAKYNIDPIDLESGIINNEYWGISSDGTNANETKEGINNAIAYASNNKIENIKLEKGLYLIDCNSIIGIEMKSNINFDLNGSTIKIVNNEKRFYSLMTIYNISNVAISNGILIGDRDGHDYDTIDSTHEWGMGIVIGGSYDVCINNMEILDTTGDGVLVDASYRSNNNINIKNNKIHNTRRQGISIIERK